MSVIPFPTRAAAPHAAGPAGIIHVYRRREVWAVRICTADGDEILALALERLDAVACGHALAAARSLKMVVEGELAHG